jgi:acylphosphatase
MTKRINLKIHGRVQGVFFRDSVQKKARELNLAGWVRNEPDRTVSVAAKGREENLKELIAWCHAGGSKFAKVEKIDIDWQESIGQFKEFEIKY